MADREIQATGHRAEVPDGVDPMDVPIVVTLRATDLTTLVFTTTPRDIEEASNHPEGDAIEHMVSNADDLILQVLAAMADKAEAPE